MKLPKWSDIESREHDDWKTERIIIDTANKTIEESEIELKHKIEEFITDKKFCT